MSKFYELLYVLPHEATVEMEELSKRDEKVFFCLDKVIGTSGVNFTIEVNYQGKPIAFLSKETEKKLSRYSGKLKSVKVKLVNCFFDHQRTRHVLKIEIEPSGKLIRKNKKNRGKGRLDAERRKNRQQWIDRHGSSKWF